LFDLELTKAVEWRLSKVHFVEEAAEAPPVAGFTKVGVLEDFGRRYV